jgi:hypothetical protein
VFPLIPGDKRPAITNWESRAAADPHRVTRCWSRGPFNIGIATGPSRLVVIDLDQPKPDARTPATSTGPEWGLDVLARLADEHGHQVPLDTYRVASPSGGLHLYFAAPEGCQLRNTAGRLGSLIDTRGIGGYIVAAGSHSGAGPYVAADSVAEPAPLPGWITHLLAERPITRHDGLDGRVAEVERRSRYAGAALRGEVVRVIEAPQGQRNQTLNAAAYALGQLVAAALLPEQLTVDALLMAAQMCGLPDREAAATIRSGMTAGTRSPRRVGSR